MRAFAEAYPDGSIVQQVAGQIPWFHNCVLLDKIKNLVERKWYMHQTIQHGWSRNVLHSENKESNMKDETSETNMADIGPDGKFIVYHSKKTGEYHVKIWNGKLGRYLISKTFSSDQKEAAEEYARNRQSEK